MVINLVIHLVLTVYCLSITNIFSVHFQHFLICCWQDDIIDKDRSKIIVSKVSLWLRFGLFWTQNSKRKNCLREIIVVRENYHLVKVI